jgi:hypothetical protein
LGRVIVRAGSPEATSRYFLLWSGVGLDGRITRSIEPRPPWFKRWGIVSYALAALRIGVGYYGAQAEIEIDGRSLSEHVVMILVCNADLYAGIFHLAPEARLDDGCLNVSVIRGWDWGSTWLFRLRAAAPTRAVQPVTFPPGTRASRRADERLPVDAEPFGCRSSADRAARAARARAVNAPAALSNPFEKGDAGDDEIERWPGQSAPLVPMPVFGRRDHRKPAGGPDPFCGGGAG